MSARSGKSNNVYPKINFVKYLGDIVRKHTWLVLGSGVIFGTLFWLTSYFQVFTSASILRFKSLETKGSHTSISSPLESTASTTEAMRDKFFLYLHSRPFVTALLEKVLQHKEGEKILKILDKSRDNVLVKIKKLFVSTYNYEVDKTLKRTRALAGIVNFKKEGNDSILMLVKTGIPELSKIIGEMISPIVRDIAIGNEAFEMNSSLEHLRKLFKASQNKLEDIETKLVRYQQSEKSFNGNVQSAPVAINEMEKELRFAKIETQRLDVLVKKLEKQISENSTFESENGKYKYIDQVSLERLSELKQQRETAVAKFSSIEKLYAKMKNEQLSLPESVQLLSHLTSQQTLEKTLNNDLFFKIREAEEAQSLIDRSIRLVGETSIVSATFKFSKTFHFVLGFFGGIFFAVVGIYYYYDFFKIIKGNHDLRNLVEVDVMYPVPKLGGRSKSYDIWKDLPLNHHALEAFGQIMDKCETARVVSFLSSEKGEGKSFLIANLAENFSRFGKKVVIVDTNWKNPTLSRNFQENSSVKLITADQFKHDKNSFLDRSLLINQIRAHAKECDMVIIDTQNLYDSNDALVVASVSNLNILLCSHLETYQHKFDTALKKLEAAELTNYSVLLNKANIKHEILSFKGRVRAMDEVDKAGSLYLKKSS